MSFAFAAPDNLTRYRVIAVAQTRAGQFGEGESSVEIAKPLIVEPSFAALPAGGRRGGTARRRPPERARQRKPRRHLRGGRGPDPGTVPRGTPRRCRGAGCPGRVPLPRESARRAGLGENHDPRGTPPIADPELADAVEVTPAHLAADDPAPRKRRGHRARRGRRELAAAARTRAPGAVGHYDAAVSTSADLPRLRALPEVLEYPHGCFEQITSRILAYCGARDLLAGLPSDPAQKDHYRA